MRRLSILISLAIAAALLPLTFAPAVAAAPSGGNDPGGNNGTVKVQEVDFDDPPNNDPHVGCTFLLEWYGFDKGADIISKVTFEMQSPTASVGLSVDGPSQVFVGGDPASGAGTATGLDGREKYTLTFDGPAHPLQGYHVKLTINTPRSKGADKKHKVFWVKGCDPVQPPAPAISLAKTVTDSNDADSVGTLGETLTYSFAVTNTGNVPLTNVTISDSKLGMVDVPCVANLAVGATATCPTRPYVVTAADIANGSVHNTATSSGKPPTGPNVTDDDDATIPTPPKPAILVDKTVADSGDADAVAALGETLTYTFKVTNTGNVPLASITISDAKLSMTDVACVPSLAVGATATCPTKTYVVTAADVAHGSVDNVATAKGTPPTGGQVSDDDPADIPTQSNSPAINLDKTVTDSNDADHVGSLGEVLAYSFVVTNTGNVPLTDVRLSDAKLGLSNVLCAANLAIGASATCPPANYTVTAADIAHGSVDNTATATGTPPTGPNVSDPDAVTIATPAVPGISVDKSVADSNDADSMASLGEVLTYTFKVSNTGNVPLAGVTITDAKLGLSGAACVASLPVGATATCPTHTYTVTSADIAHGAVHNIATATGTPPSGPDVSGDDEADIPTKAPVPSIFLDKSVADSNDADSVGSLGEVLTYSFQVTNTGTVPLTGVTISDPMFSLSNAPCVATLAPGATTSCPLLPSQTHTVTAADVAHGSVDNTATTSGTPPTGPQVTDTDDATMPVTDGTPENSELSIDKTVDVSDAAPGDTVTYTLTVENTGPGDAEDVVVTDALPSGTTFVSASAPCTQSGGTVTCELGTLGSGDTETVTIKVKVDAIGGGDTSHQHQLDYTKIESHLSIFDGNTESATATCPTGYLATDGSVRIDHVDAGTGSYEDVIVLASGVTADGRGWAATVRSDATGQVQAKVNVVCMTDKTSSGEDHSHHVVTSGPVATTRTLTSGRHEIDLSCGSGTWAMTPSFVLTDGEGIVNTRRLSAANWRFTVDVDDAAEGTFSIRCLSTALGLAQGHSHDLRFHEITDTVTVPAGEVVERRLTCAGDEKGIVAWADMEPGLVSLGNDPQPVTRVFKFYNPTGSPLSADIGLLCVAIRTNGGASTGGEIKNTATVKTSSPDATTADDKDSATFMVNATGVAVAPKASVVTSGGKTLVKLGVKSSGQRRVKIKLLAMGRVKGSNLKAGSLLAQSTAKLRDGKGSVQLLAKGAGGQALKNGKVTKARLVVTTKDGRKDVRTVRIRR